MREQRRWSAARLLAAVAVALPVLVVGVAGTTEPAAASTTRYFLPWTYNETAYVSQGVGGTFSHNCPGISCQALDFVIAGSKNVRSSAPGEIIFVRRDQTCSSGSGSCPHPGGNEVVLKHADGTCTRYSHLAHGTVTSKATKQTVGQGEVLGRQGRTGWATGDHLHFTRENCSTRQSVAVTFVDNGGKTPTVGQTLTSRNTPPPNAPGKPTCAPRVNGSLVVAWSAPSAPGGGLAEYEVGVRNRTTGGSASVKTKSRSYTRASSDVKAGNAYDFRIRARNANGWGSWSAWSSACANKVTRSIRSVASGKFVAAEFDASGGHHAKLRARSDKVSNWERFRIWGDCRSTEGCAFQSVHNGRFVGAELNYEAPNTGMLRATRTSVGTWERFRLSGDCGSSTGCGIRSIANDRWVTVEMDYRFSNRYLLRARGASLGGWERFRIQSA